MAKEDVKVESAYTYSEPRDIKEYGHLIVGAERVGMSVPVDPAVSSSDLAVKNKNSKASSVGKTPAKAVPKTPASKSESKSKSRTNTVAATRRKTVARAASKPIPKASATKPTRTKSTKHATKPAASTENKKVLPPKPKPVVNSTGNLQEQEFAPGSVYHSPELRDFVVVRELRGTLWARTVLVELSDINGNGRGHSFVVKLDAMAKNFQKVS